MAEHPSHIELTIDLEYEEDQSLHRLISSLPLETVVMHTLSQAEIEQPVLVELLLTNDETIRSLNKQYRNQDKPTDVLSFPLLENPIVDAPAEQLWNASNLYQVKEMYTRQPFVAPPDLMVHLGDIVISWPTVQRQAHQSGHSPVYELLYLLSHGVLHLIGYDDQTEAGYQAMTGIQKAVMEKTMQNVLIRGQAPRHSMPGLVKGSALPTERQRG